MYRRVAELSSLCAWRQQINVHITGPTPPSSGVTLLKQLLSLISTSWRNDRSFVVPTSTFVVKDESVIRALNDSNIVFIPFVLDPYGGLAPFAWMVLNCLDTGPLQQLLQATARLASQTAYDNDASNSLTTACTTPLVILITAGFLARGHDRSLDSMWCLQ